MKNAPLGYALFCVTPWLVLTLGGLYAYLTTLGGPLYTARTIAATALITVALCVFVARYTGASTAQARERLDRLRREARVRDTTDAIIAQSREIRRTLADTAAVAEAAVARVGQTDRT